MDKTLKEKLEELSHGSDPECYVLITCRKPNPEGEMEVELTYNGDAYLASYLVETAQNVFENQLLEDESEDDLKDLLES